MSTHQETVPKEAKIISLLLHASGVWECEPKVISALQEYCLSYTQKLLFHASKVAEIAGRDHPDSSDIRFAANKLRQQMSRPYSRDYYLEVMSKVNSKPFPPPLSSGPYTAALNDERSHSASFRITAHRNQ
jgi:hypothetical protein